MSLCCAILGVMGWSMGRAMLFPIGPFLEPCQGVMCNSNTASCTRALSSVPPPPPLPLPLPSLPPPIDIRLVAFVCYRLR